MHTVKQLTELALSNLAQEIKFARAKFPSTEDILASITEELGELAQALQEQKHEPHKGKSSEDIYKEAIQVAATAIRLAVEGTSNYRDYEVPHQETMHIYFLKRGDYGNS
jgi:NTP pyrophosphatase (non-canonical NTP hydrolase)